MWFEGTHGTVRFKKLRDGSKPKLMTFIRNDVKDENLDYIRIVPKIETLDRNSSYIFLFLIVDPMRIRLYESL